MKIGIDIDNTTFFTAKSMLKYADIFEKENSTNGTGRKKSGSINNRYYLEAIYGWDNKTKTEFFNKYYKNVLEECTMIPNANKVIKKLKEEGDTIYFITARLMNIKGCDSEAITQKSLSDFNIPYDKLYVEKKDKYPIFKEHKIDICIEDSYETCREFTNKGIKSILITTDMNRKINDPEITRVNTWDEIYDVIKEYKKLKGE